ncbi:MAG TPA: hypothetical protein GXX59_03410 [Syntrophomonadaceae bacterium]|nr:hypothetical protein [Syntrophomonadaceae bacterium]
MHLAELYTSIAKDPDHPFAVRFVILMASSWIFQGVLYMDKTEKAFKVVTELILFTFPLILLLGVLPVIYATILSLIICHTMNWILNGQIFVVLKNLKMVSNPPECFRKYINVLARRIEQKNYILAAAAYGSLSKQQLEDSSDLDVRIIRKSGFLNGVKACAFVATERSRALIKRFPLDIYVLDDVHKIEQQIDRSEANNPVILYDPDMLLKI